jgi:glyoxylase-like metal-dependent hydrolase (beta-lactamase superfamily II)
MKMMIKRTYIVLGMVTIGLLLFVGLFIKILTEVKKMTPLETQKITDDIYSINDSMVNAYLVKYEDGYIMIDAGNDIEAIKTEFNHLNIVPGEVKKIFLTHSDRDHVAAISWFPDAKIYLSRKEEQMIDGSTSRFLIFHNTIHTQQYQLVDDGDVISLPGITIKCILSPGHTPGATSYLVNEKYLFTGDALRLREGKVEEFINLVNMDKGTHRNSIQKLSQLQNIEYIFTAHHGMSNDFEFAFSKWLKE